MIASSPLVHALCPSPNFNERKGDLRYIILHYTGMTSSEAALSRLTDEKSLVSAHYFIEKHGNITQIVDEKMRAWHAGVAYWKGERDLNSLSIGIELENLGHEYGYHDYPDQQISALKALCKDIQSRHAIEAILAHSDIAPTRKEDPGELFPWHLFGAKEPIALKEGAQFREGDEGPPIQALQLLLSRFGYEIPITGVYDPQTKAVVTAFQRHYRRQLVDGIADRSTIETLRLYA